MSKKVVSKCFQTRPSALGMSDQFMDLVIKNFCPRRKNGKKEEKWKSVNLGSSQVEER